MSNLHHHINKKDIIVNNYPLNKPIINILNYKFQYKVDLYILYKVKIILKHFIKGFIIIKLTNNSKKLLINLPNNLKESSYYLLYTIIYF